MCERFLAVQSFACTVIPNAQDGDHNQEVTWESHCHIQLVFKFVKLSTLRGGGQLCRRSGSFTALVIFGCTSFSGWPTTDAQSQKSFGAGKIEGRHGHTADEVASMELIAEVEVLRMTYVAHIGRVGGTLE
jgi:hypothetical protein